MAFRAYSAAIGGHMGLELDLRALDARDRETLAAAIAFHKRWRDLLHHGRFLRLDCEPSHLAQITVAADGRRFLAAATQRETQPTATAPVLRLAGLDAAARYRVRFAEGAPVPIQGERATASPLRGAQGWTASGLALMAGGFRLPSGWPDQLWLVEGERVD